MEDPFQFLNEGAGLTPEQVERLRGEMGRVAPLSRLPPARFETEGLVLGRLDAALDVIRMATDIGWDDEELGPFGRTAKAAAAYMIDQFRTDGPCFFPLPGADRGEQLEILAEIRDLLKRQAGWRPAGEGGGPLTPEQIREVIDDNTNLAHGNCRLRAERDDALASCEHLGSELARVTAERDGLRKRVAELENELARARGQLPPGWSCRSAPQGETP